MSRAFVKEPDGDAVADDQPERPQSTHANYMTPAGHGRLSATLSGLGEKRRLLAAEPEGPATKLALAQVARDIRHAEGRLRSAIVVDPATQPANRVCFGAAVEVEDEEGAVREFTIVGEDEAEIAANRVSWISPLARALLGARVGDVLSWKRPSGDMELEVTSIRYRSE
jgi:transcription elongation factor GreB